MFRINYHESISSTCELLGFSRQVYYRAITSRQKRQDVAGVVIELVQRVRIEQPRLGTRKLYHILKAELQELGVGRDRLFAILKANKMLIKPKRKMLTPEQMHKQNKIKIKTYKKKNSEHTMVCSEFLCI